MSYRGAGSQIGDIERRLLRAAVADPHTPGYVAIRALIALGDDDVRRTARMTAMGRPFVTDIRRNVGTIGAQTLLGAPPNPQERLFEAATRHVRAGAMQFTMGQVETEAEIPHRTLYNQYKKPALIEACRRRAQMIWRARFEQRVYDVQPDPLRRPVTVVDLILAWVGSSEFAGDMAMRMRPGFTAERRDDDLREHLDAVARFATEIGDAAGFLQPEQYGSFIATTVEGASAWFDRRLAAYAASLAFVECLVARSALD